MPFIDLPPQLPGIVSLFAFREDTGAILSQLAEMLLRGESSLTQSERELIATVVSSRNECHFCMSSHAAAATHAKGGTAARTKSVIADVGTADVSPKLRTLLRIAESVQKSGLAVTEDQVAAARKEGATDREIHDTVLIAAAFSMYNRYVDGLRTLTPREPEAYDAMGKMLAEQGYVREQPPQT